MQTLVASFLKGLFIVAPIAITMAVVVSVIRLVDGWLDVPIPGLGLLLTLVAITLVGLAASNVVGRKLFGWLEAGLSRMPIVKLLYSALRDLMEAFTSDKQRFRRPVLVRLFADSDVVVVGFLTWNSFEIERLQPLVAVYIPQAYNIAGQVLLLPADRIEELDVDGAKAMAFVVSGGLAGLRQG